MKQKQILYNTAVVVLLLIFVASTGYVLGYYLEGHQRQQEYRELAAIVEDIQNDPNIVNQPLQPGQILPEYEPLYNMNRDLVGWLKIEDTRLNYPVMQTPGDGDYYLQRSFDREYSARGCLYACPSCDIGRPSDNITIYGHNMKDGSMFAVLNSYRDREFWEEHSLITFDTLYERHTYLVFAVFYTTDNSEGFPYYQFENAENEAEFDEFISTCIDLSLYDTDIVPTFGDKLICLSTCDYDREDGRLVVVAVQIS